MLMNRTYKDGTYHVGRTNMWGNYCPETGEYYLARPEGVMASARYIDICDEMKWQVQAYSGYSYEVVRELLQLGHLTSSFRPLTGIPFLNQDCLSIIQR